MVVAEVFELHQHVWPPLLNGLHKVVHKSVGVVMNHTGLLEASVHCAVKQCLVVGAHVELHGQAVVGVHACEGEKGIFGSRRQKHVLQHSVCAMAPHFTNNATLESSACSLCVHMYYIMLHAVQKVHNVGQNCQIELKQLQ